MKKENFTKTIEITPAFKDYSIHGCNLKFLLKGKKGVVQFILCTNWQLPHVTQELLNKPIQNTLDIKIRFLPMPIDLGYHSPKPIYKGQKSIGPCSYLDGKDCYYDGSSIQAEEIFKIMLQKGSDGVWEELEKYYNTIF